MKAMILVCGSSERGKSQSIKSVAKAMPFVSYISPWHDDDYDSYVIGTVKDEDGNENVVGIESQGDPNSNQRVWIEECIKADCEVIVAASRSYGKTFDTVYELARENGYEVIEVTTHFHSGGPKLPNGTDMRAVFAENVINLVMQCLA